MLHLLVEASRVSPGSVRPRLPDRDHLDPRAALVRGRYRQSHHPRAESNQGVRAQSSRGEEPVPRRQVSAAPGRMWRVSREDGKGVPGGWGGCPGGRGASSSASGECSPREDGEGVLGGWRGCPGRVGKVSREAGEGLPGG